MTAFQTRLLALISTWALLTPIFDGPQRLVWADESQPATGVDHPQEILAELEVQIQRVVHQILPTVVAVETGMKPADPQKFPPQVKLAATGVIVSADGLILSQYHVSHQADLIQADRSHPVGKKVAITFHDGTVAEARLLGADRDNDLSMLQLTNPGPYPFAPLDESHVVKLGQPVLKIGHPEGYHENRPPVVRLGRVLRAGSLPTTDCRIVGGDSGGPYFDLDGHLVGVILASSASSELRSDRVPRTGILSRFNSVPVILSKFEFMRRGEIRQLTYTDQTDPEQPVLSPTDWTQGSARRARFQADAAPNARGVVTVTRDHSSVGLGIVVDDGKVATKASLLPSQPSCRLPTGEVVAAEVIGVDPRFDIALLKVDTKGLAPIRWADQDEVAVGTLVAEWGPADEPLALGVVSVGPRHLPGPFPDRVSSAPRTPAARFEIIGSAVRGRGYWVEFVAGVLADAGVRSGDLLVQIGDTLIREHHDLTQCIRAHRAGESLKILVLRGHDRVEMTCVLEADSRIGGSGRQGPFPIVLEADVAPLGTELGGPLVNRNGEALGIIMATGSVCAKIVPAATAREIIRELAGGGRLTAWKPVLDGANRPSLSQMPVGVTIDQIKSTLEQRTRSVESLAVEYDMQANPRVDPQWIQSWRMLAIRDYRERRLSAFAGAKQMFRLQVFGDQPLIAPGETLHISPETPPNLARELTTQKLLGLEQMSQRNPDRWIGIRAPDFQAMVYDGSNCFQSVSPNSFVKCRQEDYQNHCLYLQSLGLKPIEPRPTEERLKLLRSFRMTDRFERGDKYTLMEVQESIDGANCVVLEFESEVDSKTTRVDRYWLDSRLNYSPRQKEQRLNGALVSRSRYSEYEETIPGVWLPWQISIGMTPPTWVQGEYSGKIVLEYNLQVRKLRINDVPEATFAH